LTQDIAEFVFFHEKASEAVETIMPPQNFTHLNLLQYTLKTQVWKTKKGESALLPSLR
jgi:hypothetical protein